jgi:hypothetical protein
MALLAVLSAFILIGTDAYYYGPYGQYGGGPYGPPYYPDYGYGPGYGPGYGYGNYYG